jgi:hypothetical protein
MAGLNGTIIDKSEVGFHPMVIFTISVYSKVDWKPDHRKFEMPLHLKRIIWNSIQKIKKL